jgi:hypothetical protein
MISFNVQFLEKAKPLAEEVVSVCLGLEVETAA